MGRFLIVLFLFFAAGFLRFYYSFPEFDAELGYVEVEGCVVREVDKRQDKVKYILEVESYGNVLVNARPYPLFRYGDCLSVRGQIERPEAIEDFAYDEYLARYDVYFVVNRASLERVEEAGASLYGGLFGLKGIFEGRLSEVYGEPHSSFMAGLVLGSRRGIPVHLMEDFNTTGLTHIIAISGYNITLVIVLTGSVFSFLSRRKKVLASILFIFLFVVLVGASAAVVRAGIMGSISLVALWFGREYRVEIALVLAAVIMALWNPKVIVYDVGFQLSFLATMGLIFVAPKIEKFFEWLPETLAVRESVLMTMSAQVLALPVIVYNFGRLSLISPVANLFVLPFIPLAMIFGFLSTLFAPLGFLGYLVLEVVVWLVKVFAKVPLASVEISWFPVWLLLVYYYWALEVFIFDRCKSC